jgi:hypothetical protein
MSTTKILAAMLGVFLFVCNGRAYAADSDLEQNAPEPALQQDTLQPADSDHDGIPDSWTQRYFGHPTGQSVDHSTAMEDPDNDSWKNLEEFINGTDPTQPDTWPEMVVNNGNLYTTSRSIPIQPSSTKSPNIRVSLDPGMIDATVLANSGSTTYTLPDADGRHDIYLQYADGDGRQCSPMISRMVTLDRLPPVVDITSPAGGAVLDQAFITLRAVAADPDPIQPSVWRRLEIWINDQRFWGRSGTNIVVDRFPVPPGANSFTVTIRAIDEAGLTNQVSRTWTVDTSADKVAPQLSSFNIPAEMLLPDVSEVWIEAAVDDDNAMVKAIVSAGPMEAATHSLNVHGRKVEGLVPLEFGTNHVTFVATDAAANTSSNAFTIIRTDSYRFAITNPVFGAFATAPSTTVSGYVSAKIDEGLPSEMNVTAVMINGVAAVLDWAHVDASGNVPFTTTNTIPLGVPITGKVIGDRDRPGATSRY